MRKYICDNCGQEVSESNLWALSWNDVQGLLRVGEGVFGEYCPDCREKINKRIKEGVN